MSLFCSFRRSTWSRFWKRRYGAPWIEVRHVVPDLFVLAVVWLLRPGRQRGLCWWPRRLAWRAICRRRVRWASAWRPSL